MQVRSEILKTLTFLSLLFGLFAKADVAPPTKDDLKQIQEWNKKFSKSSGLEAKVTKTLTLEVTKSEKKSEGILQISNGKLRFEVESPSKSTVVADGRFLWVAQYPHPEFPDQPTQVMKIKMDSKSGRSKDILAVLSRGAILECFSLAGVDTSTTEKRFFLQPKEDMVDFKRAQVVLSTKTGETLEVRYWDASSNETKYEFNSLKFNKKFTKGQFIFEPPKKAVVTVVGS